MRRTLGMILAVTGALVAPPAGGYNGDSHQHLVEIAYAYLKALDPPCDAQVLSYAPPDEAYCVDRCRELFVGETRDLAEGYTCPCLQRSCDPRCGRLLPAEKISCVWDCWESGEGGASCAGDTKCSFPYYWYHGPGPLWAASWCQRKCFDSYRLAGDASCQKALAPLAGSALTREQARQTVRFFQRFAAPPCPPTTYEYERGEVCPGGPAGAGTLGTWWKAPLERGDSDVWASGMHLPASGSLLGATNHTWVVDDPQGAGQVVFYGGAVDRTGTILGFYDSTVDDLHDFYFLLRFFSAAEDGLKAAAEAGLDLGEAITHAAVGVAGIVLCIKACSWTLLLDWRSCRACFEKLIDLDREVSKTFGQAREDVKRCHLFPQVETPSLGGLGGTSMFHYQASSDLWDDADGFRVGLELGDWAGAAEDLGYVLSPLFEVEAAYASSRKALENYQVRDADDGMSDSFYRGPGSWGDVLGITFSPVDNLAYYWWHKWWRGRRDGDDTGLMPLGGVLHAIQDVTIPHHTATASGGHEDYEDLISQHLDPVLHEVTAESGSEVELLLPLEEAAEERRFLERVAWYVREIRSEVILPWGGVLHIRQLMHYMRQRAVQARQVYLDFFRQPQEGEKEYLRHVGLPLAVAATAVVLTEASREDVDSYGEALNLDLAGFEHAGPVPPVSGRHAGASPSASEPEAGAAGAPSSPGTELAELWAAHPAWRCVEKQPRAREALRSYRENRLNGRELLRVVLAEKHRCELRGLGLPEPPEAVLDRLAAHEAGSLEAQLLFLAHGSLIQLAGDLACNAAAYPELYPPEAAKRLGARCAGTLDSDGDGVPDQDDRCHGSAALLGHGRTAGPDGCVFRHEAFPEPWVSPLQPGTIRVRQP